MQQNNEEWILCGWNIIKIADNILTTFNNFSSLIPYTKETELSLKSSFQDF
jgi:hypothetical protein